MPFYQLAPLIEYLPALEARQMRRVATAALVPHVDKHDRREFFYSLDDMARQLDPVPIPPEPAPKLPYDRDAARAWLEAQGMNAVVVEQVESA